MRELSQWELLGRFVLAAALGAIIGIERESRNHAAGIRTCALAAYGTAWQRRVAEGERHR
jgi:putative Mg2+ transporter-C (MgtC) family protein